MSDIGAYTGIGEGLYVARKLHKETEDRLLEYCYKLGFNPVHDFHVTVMYSTKNINPGAVYDMLDVLPRNIYARPLAFSLFGDNKDVLVMRIFSDLLTIEHSMLKAEGAKPSYPEYKPHITLCENFSVGELSILSRKAPDFSIILSEPYAQDLNP